MLRSGAAQAGAARGDWRASRLRTQWLGLIGLHGQAHVAPGEFDVANPATVASRTHELIAGDLLPLADTRPASFDYLVGAGEEYGREGEAERLCGLQIDGEAKKCRLLERQFGRLCAFENAVNQGGHPREALV